jgi:hypothetical protein
VEVTERVSITLHNAQAGHTAFLRAWVWCKAMLMAGHRLTLEIRKATRSSEQNARMWAMLTEISRQVPWHGQKLTAEDWKDMATAALKRQRVVPGIDGGFVVLGQRTSKMTVGEMAELMDFLEAFGAEHGVRFSAPEYREEAVC